MNNPVDRFRKWREDNPDKIAQIKAELKLSPVKYRDEVENMDVWLIVNSALKKAKKTDRGWPRFMKGWLARSLKRSNWNQNQKGWKKNEQRKSPSAFSGASKEELM